MDIMKRNNIVFHLTVLIYFIDELDPPNGWRTNIP